MEAKSLMRTARLAGFLYLIVTLCGPFTLMYVPGQLYVSGDATATVDNIRAHQSLFLAGIGVSLVSELIFVFVVLTLYRLFRAVDQDLAAVMVILIFLNVPLAFLGIANEVATLAFVRDGDLLAAFDEPQRDALAMFLINVDRQGTYVAEIFWGLWLLPLGALVWRSGFIPRLIGVWLILNGLAYLTMSATGLALPELYNRVFTFATPLLFGEVALMLWLLIMGARERATPGAAPA